MKLPACAHGKGLALRAALVLLAICLGACAVKAPVTGPSAGAPVPPGSTPVDTDAGAVSEPTEGAAPEGAEDEEAARGLGDPTGIAEELGPEELTGEPSPLDELAEIVPEVTPEDLAEERAVIESKETTFDIPIPLNDKVVGWVDYFTTRYRGKFRQALVRSGRYLPMIHSVFREEGVPLDLAYLVHVESAYKPEALSRAKARGLFQFMAYTGRRYGLRYDWWVDERVDPEKAARAAAAYLKDLYAMFGDWHLALAAYNAGEGKVRRSLNRTRTKDFWGLAKTRALKRETRSYVPAILAATLISKDPAQYGFEFEPEAPLAYDTIEVQGAVDLGVLARCAGTDFETLRGLNRALRRQQTPPDRTTLVRVPKGMGEATLLALDRVPPSDRVVVRHHRVRRGETLSALSRRYGVPVVAIQKANRIGSRTLLRVGQTLAIPTSAAAAVKLAAVESREADVDERPTSSYRVRRGDTLSVIARRFGTSPQAIARASGIRVGSVLRVGQRLTVPGRRAAHANGGPAPSARQEGGTHTVRRGETLWRIASLYRLSVEQLCTLNGITSELVLHPGLKLNVASN